MRRAVLPYALSKRAPESMTTDAAPSTYQLSHTENKYTNLTYNKSPCSCIYRLSILDISVT